MIPPAVLYFGLDHQPKWARGFRNQVPADEFVWDLTLAVLMGCTCVSVTLMVDMGIS